MMAKKMKTFGQFPVHVRPQIRFVLTDIDDTLTYKGRLPAVIFRAMEHLKAAGIYVIPITGRPAGWCDHIARMWPVDGLVGENGAFYFRYDDKLKKMQRRYFKSEAQRAADRSKLESLRLKILEKIPDCRVSADQPYREADLAIDYCEDIPRLSDKDIAEIVRCFEAAGARAKVSSIHVNGWFGAYDKLTMTAILFKEVFGVRLEDIQDQIIFIGDTPNDVPMFAYFRHSVGVANVMQFVGQMDRYPAWVTAKEGGYGFAEMVEILLS
jgi:HAD superfamily hydrolase (TIGR01484 family)